MISVHRKKEGIYPDILCTLAEFRSKSKQFSVMNGNELIGKTDYHYSPLCQMNVLNVRLLCNFIIDGQYHDVFKS